MPRTLSPVSLRSQAPHAESYSALVLDSFNPWPEDSTKRPYLRDDGPLLPDLVGFPGPCAKRQRLAGPQMPLRPVKPQARWAQPAEADAQETKRRRLEMFEVAEVENMMDSSEVVESRTELEEEGQALALVPAEVSAVNAARRAGCFGLSSHCPASILSCIRDAFSSPSWEPSFHHMPEISQRPWLNDNEEALDNLIIFKDRVGSSEQQVKLWSMPQLPLMLERDAEESALPGLVIFDDNFHKPPAKQYTSPSELQRIEEVPMHIEEIEEIEEVPMEQCKVDSGVCPF